MNNLYVGIFHFDDKCNILHRLGPRLSSGFDVTRKDHSDLAPILASLIRREELQLHQLEPLRMK